MFRKIILVGSGPFEHKYVERLQEIRLSRLGEEEKAEYNAILKRLNTSTAEDKASAFARLGALTSKTDRYDPLMNEPEEYNVGQENVFHGVLKEAIEMRRSGRLLELAKQIQCPVVAIHGDYDPHPAEGVQKPLSATLKRFRLILLKNCGHKPWIERQARDQFYRVLKEQLN